MDAMDQGAGRDGVGREREPARRSRSGSDPLDQRVDRWVSAGRQFVEGVAGSRPGGRPSGRGADRRPMVRPRLDDLGRWVEDRLDWLLEDGDDWREPWQEGEERRGPVPPAGPSRSRRQGLEAVSRRGRIAAPEPRVPLGDGTAGADDGEWPDDASFSLPRWQRPDRSEPREASPPPTSTPPGLPGSRPLPRSSRRRP
jgi:hypothetical protein